MELENPEETAVIVVDMQNSFCHEDGALYAPNSGEAIADVEELLLELPDEVTTVFTRDVHPEGQFRNNENYDEFERWGEHVVEGTWGAEIVPELSDKFSPDKIVEKHTYDAFYETELDAWLSAHNIETLLFCGTLANVCVLHSARTAALQDYRTIIVEDALGYIEEDDKDFAVDHAEWLFGEVTTRENLLWTKTNL